MRGNGRGREAVTTPASLEHLSAFGHGRANWTGHRAARMLACIAMSAATPTTIRPAVAADLDAILRIYNDAILTTTATWDEAPWTMQQRRAWFATHGPSQPVLVAEVQGAVAGFAYLTRMSEKSGWRFTREDTIYLDPPFHGRGIGRLLLGALLDEARTLGLRLIVASITAENAASLALHRALGFETMGTLHNAGFKFGRWLDTTYLQLDLGPPATSHRQDVV